MWPLSWRQPMQGLANNDAEFHEELVPHNGLNEGTPTG